MLAFWSATVNELLLPALLSVTNPARLSRVWAVELMKNLLPEPPPLTVTGTPSARAFEVEGVAAGTASHCDGVNATRRRPEDAFWRQASDGASADGHGAGSGVAAIVQYQRGYAGALDVYQAVDVAQVAQAHVDAEPAAGIDDRHMPWVA